jgi:hypothetical protein
MFRLRKEIRFLILGLLLCIGVNFTYQRIAFGEEEIRPYPNYLIILVHGLNSTRGMWVGHGENGSEIDPNDEQGDFGDLKGYLENVLGLKGYVYAYTFSERDGSIALQGRELGKRDEHNKASDQGGWLHHLHGDHKNVDPRTTHIKDGNCWLEQARLDFKQWFHDFGPGSKETPKRFPTEEEIPDKYIIIAHSMGGLAAREYIFSDYYQDDVARLGMRGKQQGHKGIRAQGHKGARAQVEGDKDGETWVQTVSGVAEGG